MERQSRLSGFSRFFIVLRLRYMNAQVPRGGLATGTGFQMNRPRHCGPTGILYSNTRRPKLIRKYNLTLRALWVDCPCRGSPSKDCVDRIESTHRRMLLDHLHRQSRTKRRRDSRNPGRRCNAEQLDASERKLLRRRTCRKTVISEEHYLLFHAKKFYYQTPFPEQPTEPCSNRHSATPLRAIKAPPALRKSGGSRCARTVKTPASISS